MVVHIRGWFTGTLNGEINACGLYTVMARHHEFAGADDAGAIGVANRDGGEELAES